MDNETQGFNDNETQGFFGQEKLIAPFTDSGKYRVRILRPWELEKLVRAIPKKYCKTQFEFLFYTGMRYVEAQAVKYRTDLFEGDNIHLVPSLIRKPKCKIKDRYVKLNPVGRRVAEDYFNLKKSLPSTITWVENLERWAKKADIPFEYRVVTHKDGSRDTVKSHFLSAKTLRKTWESYLVFTYPNIKERIFISQGHTELTALKSYINLPFSLKDKEEMLRYVSGWQG